MCIVKAVNVQYFVRKSREMNTYEFCREVALGLVYLAYPKVCVICKNPLSDQEEHLCWNCIRIRFEEMNAEYVTDSSVLKPNEIIDIVHLWKFDKGGFLQDVMHHLKYGNLSGIGRDVGKALGRKIRRELPIKSKDLNKWLLVPVPLHRKKLRKRGYNQAEEISKGIQEIMNIRLIEDLIITRKKQTKTQTGFSLKKRQSNLNNAFQVSNEKNLRGKNLIIVDDIFTTGATTFELAKTLSASKPKAIYIATIAKA